MVQARRPAAKQPEPVPANLTHPLFVSAEASRQVLAFPDAIAALRAAYSVPTVRRSARRASSRAAMAIGCARSRPSPPGSRYMGAKMFGFGRTKSVSYLIALFEQETGALAALVDANLITAYRTAATSAVAVDRLAPPGPAILGVLGSGLEAQMHVAGHRERAPGRARCACSVRPPANRDGVRARRFAEELGVAVHARATARRRP